MLAQKFQRKGAETQRRKGKIRGNIIHWFCVASLLLCVFALILFSLSCAIKPTDMRSLVPADSLVYLETNDLAGALQPIVDSKPFNEVAKSKPDFSALKGVQLAVAVTGFKADKDEVNEEQWIGRVTPRFVAIADTHAWNFQAAGFAEKKLGLFVEKIYDSQPTLEKTDKNGGKYFTWTSADGRKAYALLIDSLIFFGNDESAIEKCLAVKRGEADGIVKTNKVQSADPQTLASGYVSTDGIAQIANIVGIQLASESSEDSEIQSAIADIVPQILRKSITDINWTASKTDKGIEDKYLILIPTELANLFNETMAPSNDAYLSLLNFVPNGAPSLTLYNLKNPLEAWRSLLLAAQKQADPLMGAMIGELSGILFEPYGIRDPELFLSAINSTFVITKCDSDGENPAVIATTQNPSQVQRAMLDEMRPIKALRFHGGQSWKSDDNSLGAFFIENKIAIGDYDCVRRIDAEEMSELGEPMEREDGWLKQLRSENLPFISTGQDSGSTAHIAEMLAAKKSDASTTRSTYLTETRFTKTGIERKTTSDFGLIGSIIAQMAQE